MKIYALSVLEVPPSGSATLLAYAQDVQSFSFYQRGAVGDFLGFFTRTVAERVPQGQRQSIQENNYTFHVYNRGGPESLVCAYNRHSQPPFIQCRLTHDVQP